MMTKTAYQQQFMTSSQKQNKDFRKRIIYGTASEHDQKSTVYQKRK